MAKSPVYGKGRNLKRRWRNKKLLHRITLLLLISICAAKKLN